MLFLHGHGVSTNLAIKIYKQYQEASLEIVQSDPYRLSRDIHGVGFKTADRIAQALGLPVDHPSRVEAGILYALTELNDDGHVYAPRPALFEKAANLLEVDASLLPPALERLAADDRVRLDQIPIPGDGEAALPSVTVPDQHLNALRELSAGYEQLSPGQGLTQAVYLTPFYISESGVAERLRKLSGEKSNLARFANLTFLDPTLSVDQQAAIRTALSHPVSILTGGPGTGKTTCLKALIAALETARKTYALASPTGRAAKRLSEATGRPASTIHRLLGFSPREGFKSNAENPLNIDLLVLDEVSMLDLLLANHLLKAIRPGTHLVLVGDADQLPSVGAGDVLRDLIDSGIAPVTRLQTIFRQAAGSLIITNAHRINQGQMPDFPASGPDANDRSGESPPPGDFFLFPAEDGEEAARWVEQVVCDRIPRKFGLRPMEDIQVLAPMYRGPAGVNALNARLQAALNPASPLKPEKTLYGQLFRPGDRVMQIRNNYDKDAYNGDIGRLVNLDMINHALLVDFDGRKVSYDWSEADQLVLAYAISVHKSQGSEFPVVVMPLVTQHYMMLQRNLLYTAVTRARRLCVLVGSRKAIAMAVRSNKVAQRYSALDWRLLK
jgi:exodeoxyribonuclease V alpha subunit